MGGGGGQSSSSQTQESKQEHKEVRLPPWVEAASQANYQLAQEIAGRPYQAYGGPTLANLDPTYWQARGMLPSLKNYGQYDKAQQALQGLLGFNPADISQRSIEAPLLRETSLDPYMNRYLAATEANAIRNATEAGNRAQVQLAADATRSGGLGGSRQGIQQAVQGAKTAQGIGELSNQIRAEGFKQAQAAATADITRQYEAAKQTGDWQQAAEIESRRQDVQAAQERRQAAAGLVSAEDAERQARMGTMAQYLGLGQMRQEQQQRFYDDLAGKWQKKYDYPLTQLNILMAALGMSPYGHTEDSTSTGTSSTTSKSSGGGGGFGSILSGAMGAMKLFGGLGALSDEREKTNVQQIGTLGELPIYAYDYKADVAEAKRKKRAMGPKRVGPMAQDIEVIAPHLVRTVGRRKVIDLSSLAEV